ncbi:13454_t:CDS:2 [Funneliformis caledonium]|uniref:13454_t:CDS:1 n=1 Tax=Funneliformis caledonium TaxID=1117310 RepID=A0A9N8Z812_9GLOM|nr:13454_t:CDS:2 [Funneliformis caledonium]
MSIGIKVGLITKSAIESNWILTSSLKKFDSLAALIILEVMNSEFGLSTLGLIKFYQVVVVQERLE